MADGSKVKDTTVQWTEATPAGYMSGFGNDFETEALPGALPVGRNSPQKGDLRPLRRAALGLAVHRAAGHQRALLALPHPARRSSTRGRFQKIDAGLIWTAPARATRATCRSANCAGARCRSRSEPLTFLTGLRTMTTAGDAEHAGRHGRAHLSRHRTRWSTSTSSTPTASC